MAREESWKEAIPFVQELIVGLAENPPPVRPEKVEYEDPMAASRAIGQAYLDRLRRMACKQTGMTLEQLLEAEKNISWPKEIMPVVSSPRQVARRRMKQAGVPELFIRSVGDVEPRPLDAWRHVRDFLDSGQSFLVLSGGKGTGKTGSACWSLGQIDGGRFLDAPEITGMSIREKEQWDRVRGAPLVVLDDLGTERRDEKGYFIGGFFDLFNGCYSGCTRLVITCNISREQFASEPDQGGYGARVYDRLRETGRWVTVGGESIREPGEEG